LKRVDEQDADLQDIERQIKAWQKRQEACQAIAQIPGIGLLTATALVATMGEAQAFKSGREFAAFIGLVPRQSGTGGKVKLLGISKRGDTYLRTLLIHGARAVMFKAKDKGAWSEALLQRRPTNVAIVALANKMARTAWAILAHGREYQKGYVSQRPA
jgi:transposase